MSKFNNVNWLIFFKTIMLITTQVARNPVCELASKKEKVKNKAKNKTKQKIIVIKVEAGGILKKI